MPTCLKVALLMAAQLLPVSALGAQQRAMDLSFGLGDRAGRASVAVSWSLRLGPVSLGVGPRLTVYGGAPVLFTRRGGDLTLPDTATIDPGVAGLNLQVLAEMRLVGPIGLGANLDVAGGAVGPSRTRGSVVYRPSYGSLFLYGHRDRGSLNSEFFIRMTASPRWQVRGGLSLYVLGYTGTVVGSAARYNRFLSVPFIAVTMRR